MAIVAISAASALPTWADGRLLMLLAPMIAVTFTAEQFGRGSMRRLSETEAARALGQHESRPC